MWDLALGFGVIPGLVVAACLFGLSAARAQWQALVYRRHLAARASSYLGGGLATPARAATKQRAWGALRAGLGGRAAAGASRSRPAALERASPATSTALGLAAATGIWLVTGNPYVAPVFGLLAGFTPVLLIRRRRRQREQLFIQQLPDALSLISNILAAGGTLVQALRASLPYLHAPLLDELQQVVADYSAGRSLDEGLRRMQRRVGVEEINLLLAAVLIQQRLGGNLNELLRGTADLLRERAGLRRQVTVLTGQVRTTAMILAALPVVLLVYLGLTQPEQIEPLRSTVTGQILFAVATALWFAAGGLIIRMLNSVRI